MMVLDTRPEQKIAPATGAGTARRILGLSTAVVAAAITALFVAGVVDALTSDYVGGEVLVVRMVLAVTGSLALLAWSGAVVLLTSKRGAFRRSRLMKIGTTLVLAGFVIGLVVPVEALSLVAFGVAGLGVLAVLVGAIRA